MTWLPSRPTGVIVLLAFACGLAVRVGVGAYGVWQDTALRVRYTDVDFDVLTDAAAAMAHGGGSPYARATFRYTPLLAALLVPGHWLGVPALFGKALFCVLDVVAAVLLFFAACDEPPSSSPRSRLSWKPLAVACGWLFNPFSINISTRGSHEAVTCTLLAGCLLALRQKRPLMLGVLLGVATHIRVFPIIFALPLLFHVRHWRSR
jgi:phosphatidylinositol glycan class M